jgi:hypothetical protein
VSDFRGQKSTNRGCESVVEPVRMCRSREVDIDIDIDNLFPV